MTANPAFDLLFVDPIDRGTDENLVEEMFWSMLQRHPFYVHDEGSSTINLYGEPLGEPVYAQYPTAFPFHVKIDPEKQLLEKYGYTHPRDAILFFSSKIQRKLSLYPKVGDRFDFSYVDTHGVTLVEHYEITESRFATFARQTKVPYIVSAVAVKTHKRIQPPRDGSVMLSRTWIQLSNPATVTQNQIDNYEGVIAINPGTGSLPVTVSNPTTITPGLRLYLFNDPTSLGPVVFTAGTIVSTCAIGRGQLIIWSGTAWMLQV